jgi:hypothetical protein
MLFNMESSPLPHEERLTNGGNDSNKGMRFIQLLLGVNGISEQQELLSQYTLHQRELMY